MKKISILCSALLLTLASVGCGNSADSSAPSSDAPSSEIVEPTTKPIAYYDPFQNLEINIECENPVTITESTATFPPYAFEISLDAKAVPFTNAFNDYNYKTTLESIDLNSVTIKLTLEEDTVKSIEKEDLILDPIEKEFVIPTDEFEKYFFSDSQLTPDLTNQLIDNVKNDAVESENIDIEKESLTPVKFYYINHDFPIYNQEAYDQNSFGSKGSFSEIDYTFAVIFKNATDQYVALLSSAVLSQDSTEVKSIYTWTLPDNDSGTASNMWFSSENDAYNRIILYYDNDASRIKEIPIS
ncbi:hypothetical protein [Ruminococcus sp. XPD3002]|uniref:hypothetical protein n=1 Tax=Ruminococcus sp. XPD3002 TaxID=1452269 RepID=UPI00091058FD|nr:hypothetical protein SAMN04487832_111113 [Ruminococcus flavefaciens]